MSDVLSTRAARAIRMLGTYGDELIEEAYLQLLERKLTITTDALLDTLQKHGSSQRLKSSAGISRTHREIEPVSKTAPEQEPNRVPLGDGTTRPNASGDPTPNSGEDCDGTGLPQNDRVQGRSEESESDEDVETDGSIRINEDLFKNLSQSSNYTMSKVDLHKLKLLNERIRRKRLCRKCNIRTSNVLLLPCRHVPACHVCIATIETCPEAGCGIKFQAKVNVFWP